MTIVPNPRKSNKHSFKKGRTPANKKWDSLRDSRLFRTYGIREDEYQAMFEKQGGLCAICDQPETRIQVRRDGSKTLGSLCVDHDHETGRVRGLLCHRCNITIGRFGDNPEMLRRATKYLEEC